MKKHNQNIDHLGNIRASFTKDPATNLPKLIKENHYYPFGLKHSYNSTEYDFYYNSGTGTVYLSQPTNKFKYQYNGKEFQSEFSLNQYDYGARMYDPAIGRWGVLDPLAEKYQSWSPYNYVYNNPLKFVDPTGMGPDGDIYNLNGVHIGNDGIVDNKVYLKRTKDNTQLSTEESKQTTDIANEAPCVSNTVNLTDATGITNDELNVRATLSTIMKAEAGKSSPSLNYNSWFGTGNTFTSDSYEKSPDDYKTHPGMHHNPTGSAAGAYQFLKRFYTGIDFSPSSQDKAAISLMGKKGLSLAKSGNIVDFGNLMGSTQKWTSFSHWKNNDLISVFNKNRANELLGNSRVYTKIGQLLNK